MDMKYGFGNQPIQCILTESTCYKKTGRMTPKGILWHCTGANNPDLKRYVQPSNSTANRAELMALLGRNIYGNDWNHIYLEAGVNAFIGKLADGAVATVQTLPWNYRPWGCGSGRRGSCNDGWIQFEMCEGDLTDKAYFEQVYKEACELTAYLCKLYNINPNGSVSVNGYSVPTILCHYDSYTLGMGSGHYDVYNWFEKQNKTMGDVRRDVEQLLAGSEERTSDGAHATIWKGSSNDDVKTLQTILSELGYNVGPIDGFFGDYTETAVIQYQKDRNLVDDGIVGDQTWKSLDGETYNSTSVDYQNGGAYTFSVGDIVAIRSSATNYYEGKKISDLVKKKNWIVKSVSGDRVVLNESTDGLFTINSPFYSKDLYLVRHNYAVDIPEVPYIVRVTVPALNIRSGAGMGYSIIGVIEDKGSYTIIEEKNGFGNLKAGGWIALEYTEKRNVSLK